MSFCTVSEAVLLWCSAAPAGAFSATIQSYHKYPGARSESKRIFCQFGERAARLASHWWANNVFLLCNTGQILCARPYLDVPAACDEVNVPEGSNHVPAGPVMCHWPVGHHKITALLDSVLNKNKLLDRLYAFVSRLILPIGSCCC
jgi:hypothetical protein